MAENNQNETEAMGTSSAVGGIADKLGSFFGNIFGKKEEEELDPDTMITYGWDYSQDKTYVISTPDNKNDEPEVYTETQIDEMRKEIAAYDVEDELVKQGVKHDTIYDNGIYDYDAYIQAYASMKGGNYAEDNAKTAEDSQSLGQFYDSPNSVQELVPDDLGTDEMQDRFRSKYGEGEHVITTDGKESCFKANNRVFVSPYDSGLNGMTVYGTESEEKINAMREIVAAADAIDGKGNYEDNLKELQSGKYRDTPAKEEDLEEIAEKENTIEPISPVVSSVLPDSNDDIKLYGHAGDTDTEEDNKNTETKDASEEENSDENSTILSKLENHTGKLANAAGIMALVDKIEDTAFESEESEESEDQKS